MKRLFFRAKTGLILAALLAIGLSGTTVSAALKAKRSEYEGKGRVEVGFSEEAAYGPKLTVEVKDEYGKRYRAIPGDRGGDDMEFRIVGVKAGRFYNWTIRGIKGKKDKKYTVLSGATYVPTKAQIRKKLVRSVKYKTKNGKMRVEFEFFLPVEWSRPSLAILSQGKNYKCCIRSLGSDEAELCVKKLTRMQVYRYKIKGIRARGEKTFRTIEGVFVA